MGMSLDFYVGFGVSLGEAEGFDIDSEWYDRLKDMLPATGFTVEHRGVQDYTQPVVIAEGTLLRSWEWAPIVLPARGFEVPPYKTLVAFRELCGKYDWPPAQWLSFASYW